MGKGKRKRRFRFGQYFALALVLGVIGYGVYLWKEWRDAKAPPIPISITPQSAEPVAPPKLNQEMDAPIADRRQVAYIIIEALNKYYADHQEYPPFLLGGFDEKPNADPLIEGGYLDNYPQLFPNDVSCECGPCGGKWLRDERCYNRWLCMYSTPGDHIIAGKSIRILEHPEGRIDYGKVPSIPQIISDPGPDDRQFVVGGRELGFSLNPRRSSYSFWSGESFNRHHVGGVGSSSIYGHMIFFGYQRGEWLDQDVTETWLWFYGSNLAWSNSKRISPEESEKTPEDIDFYSIGHPNQGISREDFSALWRNGFMFSYQPPQGLDLVNAITGEPVPDGIPDGICLQYILRDGELVESIAALGLN